MNRWLIPGLVVATVAVTTAAAVVLPSSAFPSGSSDSDAARVSLLCPSFRAATSSVRVAAASTGEGLWTARASAPSTADEADGVTVLKDVVESVRVSGLRRDTFGAVSVAEASAGPERGLSAATCQAPRTEHWFAAVDVSEAAQADLVLVNIDASEAAVDVTVWSDTGRLAVPGSRGVAVAGDSERVLSLGPLLDSATPVSLQVETSQGRVAAFVRQRWWQGTTSLGADWVAAGRPPAGDLVIPGVPGGPGARDLVVANPGDRTAAVRIEFLGASGRAAIAGYETVEVPPQTTRVVPMANGLAEQPGALRLVSSQPVTASVKILSAGGVDRRDPAVLPATAPLGADGLWPVAISTAAQAVVSLSNPSTEDAMVTLTAGNSLGGPGQVTQLLVPAGTTVDVPLEEASVPVVRLQTDSATIHAVLTATKTLGKVSGIAVITMGAGQAAPRPATIHFDPHAGS